jgi:CRP/FNR family cyclic AMP-dependent transcriptional regulator
LAAAAFCAFCRRDTLAAGNLVTFPGLPGPGQGRAPIMIDGSDGRGRKRVGGEWAWPARSLLGSLSAPARDRLLALGAIRQYPADRVLIRELDDTGYVLVLMDGIVKVTARAQDGRPALLAVRIGGDLVGELAALDGRDRSATVTSCGTVVARVVSRPDFLDCLRRDPQIAQAVSESVVAKFREASARQVDFAGSDVATRLARVLYHVAMTYGQRAGNVVRISWPITQPELATLAGAAEPTAHRALRQFREAGVVTTGYRSITVNDLARLQALAYPGP